ncbi:MAG: M48 family metallopeptidase [Oscillatoriaceae cyanobacterium]
MSDRQEVELGKQIDEQVKGEYQIYQDREITAYVENIGKRLVPQSNRPKLPFTFQVVNDDSINAFATAGGFVYVNTGLLKAADTEAEVAGVIGHEIGHITNKHVLKQIRQSVIAGGLADAAGLDRNTVVNLGFEFGIRRPRSRQQEFEADSTGLDMVVRSGYAPSGMISFFQKLLGQGSVPTLLSTHPATQDRITRLQQEINQKYPDRANSGDGLDSAAYRQKIRKLL